MKLSTAHFLFGFSTTIIPNYTLLIAFRGYDILFIASSISKLKDINIVIINTNEELDMLNKKYFLSKHEGALIFFQFQVL